MNTASKLWLVGCLAAPLLASCTFKASNSSKDSSTSTDTASEITYPQDASGWTDLDQLLVISDGTYSLGDSTLSFNSTRDQGSKIVYINSSSGDNDTADVYWWNGYNIVDSTGSTTDSDGETYGTDPLHPNEDAILPFENLTTDDSDSRIVTQQELSSFEEMAGGYPDWFLFRRGETVSSFNHYFTGGRSEEEPAVYAGYGPVADGRVIYEPDDDSSKNVGFNGHADSDTDLWFHEIVASFEIRDSYTLLNSHLALSANGSGGPVTAFLEDCYFPSMEAAGIIYPPRLTTIRRSIITGRWESSTAHVQGYFTNGYLNQVVFDETIFYKNGFKSDPVTEADPVYDKFSRNIYQGGGARMGHVYRNIISADGASGGPQMRYGGLLKNSLIVEGYFYSSTTSNGLKNDWLESDGQDTQSAVVKNNVQLLYAYPTANDPDTDSLSDSAAQPGLGYTLQGASFGAEIEDNIISGAMLEDDLGGTASKAGLTLSVSPQEYEDGNTYTQVNNTFSGNIIYRAGKGMSLEGDFTDASNLAFSDNVFVATTPVETDLENLSSSSQLTVSENRFYSDSSLPDESNWFDSTNTLASYSLAETTEGWTDPDRTLRRYVEEELGLTLLDWSDDDNISSDQVTERDGETYDPTGLKTFMAVATHMRRGGTDAIPSSGKPSLDGDYPWDERFTGEAVVNWIREGFNMSAVDDDD